MENGFSATFQATADLSALLWKKGWRKHLRQALPGIIDASGGSGADGNQSGLYFQPVGLRPVLLQGGILLNADGISSTRPIQSKPGSLC